MRHRIKVYVAYGGLGAPQKNVRHRINFQCATEFTRIIYDFVLPAIHIQVIDSNIQVIYGNIQKYADII
jgi:hypothetical protein